MKRFAMLVLLLTPACSSSPDIPAGTGLGGSGGGGGAAGAGGGAGTAVKTMSCPDSGHGPVDPTALIDNMEAGGSALPMELRPVAYDAELVAEVQRRVGDGVVELELA